MAGQARLAGARGAGDEHAGARGNSPCRRASRPAPATPLETRSADAGWSIAGGRDRHDGDAAGVDEEGKLVGAVGRAAVLDDPQPAGGDLLDDAVVEQDHAVGDVLLQAVAGQRALAPLAGDDGGDALVLEPAEQPAELGPQDGGVGQAAEQDLDGVQHDALGADRVDGVAEADEQPFEVVLAGLLDLAPLDVDVVHGELLPGDRGRRGRSRASGRWRPVPRPSPRRP